MKYTNKARIRIRIYEPEKDYQMVSAWWEGHGWPAVIPELLPPLGAVAYDESTGECVAASWVYWTIGSTMALMEWTVSNPSATFRSVMSGLFHVQKFLEEQSELQGYGLMFTTCHQKSLVRLWEKFGYKKSDEGMTHMIKVISKEDK